MEKIPNQKLQTVELENWTLRSQINGLNKQRDFFKQQLSAKEQELNKTNEKIVLLEAKMCLQKSMQPSGYHSDKCTQVGNTTSTASIVNQKKKSSEKVAKLKIKLKKKNIKIRKLKERFHVEQLMLENIHEFLSEAEESVQQAAQFTAKQAKLYESEEILESTEDSEFYSNSTSPTPPPPPPPQDNAPVFSGEQQLQDAMTSTIALNFDFSAMYQANSGSSETQRITTLEEMQVEGDQEEKYNIIEHKQVYLNTPQTGCSSGIKYVCSCRYKSTCYQEFLVHLRTNDPKYNLKCERCPKVFRALPYLKSHYKNTHLMPEHLKHIEKACNHCGVMFTSTVDLIKHKKEMCLNEKEKQNLNGNV